MQPSSSDITPGLTEVWYGSLIEAKMYSSKNRYRKLLLLQKADRSDQSRFKDDTEAAISKNLLTEVRRNT